MNEEVFNIIDVQHNSETEANRFASELLMPSEWLNTLRQEEENIESLFTRVIEQAEVSYTAARIKLINNLPPGYVCIQYDKRNNVIGRIDETQGTSSKHYLSPGDRTRYQTLCEKFDKFSTDSCVLTRGSYELRWWRLDSSELTPDVTSQENSADYLRSLVDWINGTRDRGFNTRVINRINGYASVANGAAPSRSVDALFGMLRLVFNGRDVQDAPTLKKVVNHHDFVEYMAIKASELSAKVKIKARRYTNPKNDPSEPDPLI